MATIHVTDSKGEQKTVQADAGYTLMEVLSDEDFDEIEAICGGSCSCATCHVHIDPAWQLAVGGPGDDESELLSALLSFQDNSRLSCQVPITEELDGMKLVLPETE